MAIDLVSKAILLFDLNLFELWSKFQKLKNCTPDEVYSLTFKRKEENTKFESSTNPQTT